MRLCKRRRQSSRETDIGNISSSRVGRQCQSAAGIEIVLPRGDTELYNANGRRPVFGRHRL